MCQGWAYQHTECNHYRGFTRTERCPHGAGEGHCRAAPPVIAVAYPVSRPGLCPDCFRSEEAEIFEIYNNEIRRIQPTIDSMKRISRKRSEGSEIRAQAAAEASRLTAVVASLRQELAEQVSIFRSRQGVWGDG